MSDSDSADGAAIQPAAVPVGPSAGTMLREAREAAGLHISALAVSLKVPVKKLEALEADDLAQLPDAVFARALAASVCRTLKIDPDPVLHKLPQLHAAALPIGGQGQEVRMDRYRGPRLSTTFSLPKPVVMLTAVLLVGAVVVLLLPSLRGSVDAVMASPDGEAPPIVADVPMLPVPAAPVPAALVPSSGTAPMPTDAASATAAAVVPAASAAAPSAAAATAEPAALAVFTTREPAWIQVLGADGVVHLRKTMGAGETVRINGAVPLSVVVGRANVMDVQVRGKAFDLAPMSKDNVARFQIK